MINFVQGRAIRVGKKHKPIRKSVPVKDMLDTIEWRQAVQSEFATNGPWAVHIRTWSDTYAPNQPWNIPHQWIWDYLYSVGVEQSNPELSQSKMRQAVESFVFAMTGPPASNLTHNGIYWPVGYARLYDAMKPDELQTSENALRLTAENIIGLQSWGPTTRLQDSDMLVGNYGFIRGVDYVLGTDFCLKTKADNPWIGSSGADMEFYLNKALAIAKVGGQWIESSQYDLGTIRELVLLDLFFGMPRCPDIAEFRRQTAKMHEWHHTPNMQDVMQYGDNEHPHELQPYYRSPLYNVLHKATDEPTELLDMSKHIRPQPDSASWIADWHSIMTLGQHSVLPELPNIALPSGLRVCGMGMNILSQGDDYLNIYYPLNPENFSFDHQMGQQNVRWYCNGWLLDSPIGYMPWSRQHNAVEWCGFVMCPNHQIDRVEMVGGQLEIDCSAYGPHLIGTFMPPPAFVKNWLTNFRFGNGILEFRDRINAVEPDAYTLGRIDNAGYLGTHTYENRIGKFVRFFHAPPGPAPQQIEGGFTYTASNGVQMKILSNAPNLDYEQVVSGVNIGTVHPGVDGGWLMCFITEGHDITCRLGKADDPNLVIPPISIDAAPEQHEKFFTYPGPGPDDPPPPIPVDPPAPPIPPDPILQGDEESIIVLDDLGAELLPTLESWTTSKGEGFDGELKYAFVGEGRACVWKVILTPGKYRIAATWVPYINRSTDARYTVDGDGIVVNQQLIPEGIIDRVHWKLLKEIEVTQYRELVIELGGGTNGNLIADAIRVSKLKSSIPEPDPKPDEVKLPLSFDGGRYTVMRNAKGEVCLVKQERLVFDKD